MPALARGELAGLAPRCAALASAGADLATTRHLEEVAARIHRALDKVKVESEPRAAAAGSGPRRRIEEF
jgi:hypothetical protein